MTLSNKLKTYLLNLELGRRLPHSKEGGEREGVDDKRGCQSFQEFLRANFPDKIAYEFYRKRIAAISHTARLYGKWSGMWRRKRQNASPCEGKWQICYERMSNFE
jgi:hypothetical protein